ncbi:MAG: hypothetical protein BWY82_02916 [Verrucomicrobia bacterium ADurb.Bin474]|nr:MAG: hypothetical protein BWY82_02916 [Verrucomicrobia bacterium ADurb.Bin474]
MSPPMRAWDELLGRPSHQVMRFHAMAPPKAASTRKLFTTPGWTIPVPMVLATGIPAMKMAVKLKKEAHTTALWGESTRVDTTVAMELAES